MQLSKGISPYNFLNKSAIFSTTSLKPKFVSKITRQSPTYLNTFIASKSARPYEMRLFKDAENIKQGQPSFQYKRQISVEIIVHLADGTALKVKKQKKKKTLTAFKDSRS